MVATIVPAQACFTPFLWLPTYCICLDFSDYAVKDLTCVCWTVALQSFDMWVMPDSGMFGQGLSPMLSPKIMVHPCTGKRAESSK